MPALEMAQETGKILRWLKAEGASVTKGEPIMEIETDKVTVEIESPASGTLANVTAHEGDVIPVGQTIAWVLAQGEKASPVARKIAEEQGIDLALVKPGGGKIEKADVLAYLASPLTPAPLPSPDEVQSGEGRGGWGSRVRSSPKARRLAQERGIDIGTLKGSGPDGAIIAKDIPSVPAVPPAPLTTDHSPLSTVWRVMAERMTTSWTTAPHFYLMREVNASRLIAWRERVKDRAADKITFTDLLVKIVAAALKQHPRVNAAWNNGAIVQHSEINVGIAVAIDDGLIVPVLHRADTLSLSEIVARRRDVVERAQAGKLRLADIQGGTFTLSNLGMYGVDAFNAIVNPPQAAILAVGRIADRVVALDGQPVIRPMMTFTLSCDHRAVDGARGAQFLDAVAGLVEEPLELVR